MRTRLAPALIGLTALVGSACGSGGGGTPEEQLSAALQTLTGEDFAWDLTVEASSGALSAVAQDVEAIGMVSPYLTSIGIHGTRVGDDATFVFGALGADLLTIRSIDEGSNLFARLDIQGLLDLGQIDSEQLVQELGTQGLPAEMLGTLSSALGGEWIGLDVDLDNLVSGYAQPGDAGTSADLADAMTALMDQFDDPTAFLDRMGEVTIGEPEDGAVVYEVTIDTAAVAEFLMTEIAPLMAQSMSGDQAADLGDMQAAFEAGMANAPATIPGLKVSVAGGHVTRIEIDLDEIAAAFGAALPEGENAGLVFAISRDNLVAVEAPEVTATITTDDLTTLFGFATMAG